MWTPNPVFVVKDLPHAVHGCIGHRGDGGRGGGVGEEEEENCWFTGAGDPVFVFIRGLFLVFGPTNRVRES